MTFDLGGLLQHYVGVAPAAPVARSNPGVIETMCRFYAN